MLFYAIVLVVSKAFFFFICSPCPFYVAYLASLRDYGFSCCGFSCCGFSCGFQLHKFTPLKVGPVF